MKEYEIYMARGASHIASMLHAESIHAAVKETGLARKLEQRRKPEAAAVLQHFIKRSRSRGVEELEAMLSLIRKFPAQRNGGCRAKKTAADVTEISGWFALGCRRRQIVQASIVSWLASDEPGFALAQNFR
jgi:hypothetical protein